MKERLVSGSEHLTVRVRDLERDNKALGTKVAELQRQLHALQTAARPLGVRLAISRP